MPDTAPTCPGTLPRRTHITANQRKAPNARKPGSAATRRPERIALAQISTQNDAKLVRQAGPLTGVPRMEASLAA